MIQIDMSDPAAFAVFTAVIFLAAYGAFWLSHTILRGAQSARDLAREPDPMAAAAPLLAPLSYSVFGSTDYHTLVEPTPPAISEWRSWDSGWAGEPTAWWPTIKSDIEDDIDFEPTPPRARTRFEDLLAGPPKSETQSPSADPADEIAAPQAATVVTIHDPAGRYDDLHAPLAVA